jgi:NTE family protein
MPQDERHRADAVFEGGGVKGIAFAGAIAAAERDAGVREWVNVAGTSAGAIVATLLVAGYDSAGLRKILTEADYSRFADYGFGGKWIGGAFNALFRLRGLAPGRYLEEWLRGHLAASPLARELGKTELTFADMRRRDLPMREELSELTDEQYRRAAYRLHVIASDLTEGQMLILPEALDEYQDVAGRPLARDDFPVVEAVRMSTSYPFLFNPGILQRQGRPHYVVDGGLLSSFPIWLFDTPRPKRPTWGFRLHPGTTPEAGLPYRKIPRPLWEVPLLKAMFAAAMEACDREQMREVVLARTVTIPTHGVASTDFDLSSGTARDLYRWGEEAAASFFREPGQIAYLNSFGERLSPAGKTAAQPLTATGQEV